MMQKVETLRLQKIEAQAQAALKKMPKEMAGVMTNANPNQKLRVCEPAKRTPVRRADGAVLLAAGEQLLRQPEVADHDLAGLVHHQVGGLDVAVDHAVLVQVVEAVECLWGIQLQSDPGPNPDRRRTGPHVIEKDSVSPCPKSKTRSTDETNQLLR